MSDLPFTAPDPATLAELLPAYEVEAFIAQGGMGAVYKARQRSLDRDVAIKILPRELGEDPVFRRSFETEARAMARLNHPNLISVYDSGDVAGLPYIIMEYVHGKSLFHSAHGQIVDPGQAAEIVIGICRGLAHAHEAGIIHRDIKPANILLTPRREPKIGDFGLARPSGDATHGLHMGTPGYTAPEVHHHPENADHRSDLFAVGAILHEMLTGRSPDEAGPPSPDESLGDPALDEIWQTAVQPDPALRFPDAASMADALENWRSGSAAVTDIADAPHRERGTRPLGLLRNAAVAALLVAALIFTWQKIRPAPAPAVEPAPTAASTPAPSPPPDPDPTEESKPVPEMADIPPTEEPVEVAAPSEPTETPARSLLRLRKALAAGQRDELPIGTASRGDSDFFFVPSPMTWQEARNFADAYGGHPAIPSSPGDLIWLAGQIPKSDPDETEKSRVWLGVFRSFDGSWQGLDGTSLPPAAGPAGEGTFATLERDGVAHAADPQSRHPFFIQWHRDGSHPASLAAILKRTADTLDSENPFFPPGTVRIEGRHLLVVSEPSDATAAADLAAAAGGHLAVPSTPDEADELAAVIADQTADKGFWLGARRKGSEWFWDTGETWTFARWAADHPGSGGGALVLMPDGTWHDADPESEASGLIIEWGEIPESPSAPERDDLAGLKARAGELLLTFDQQRQAELKPNIETFIWNLDVWLRGNSKNDAARWTPGVDLLKSIIRDNRLPADIPRNSGAAYSPDTLKLLREYHAKQLAIDTTFRAKAAKLRDAWVDRVAAAIKIERQRGQPELAAELEESLRLAADLDAWIATFPGVASSADPEMPAVTILSANYGTRGKNADVTARVKELIEDKQQDFHVNPGILGADPDPGWNKSLTIEFDHAGKTRTRSWGENSEVKVSFFTEE